MARTRAAAARIPEQLEAAARERSPELAALDLSTLLRVGLAVLAGSSVAEAIASVKMRPGPRGPHDRTGAAV